MSLITLFTPRILLLNTTNINLAYYHSWSGIGEDNIYQIATRLRYKTVRFGILA